jgi:hypothetical protein
MSNSATIDINILLNDSPINVVEIINKLIDFGWSLNDNGQISYLPLGDNDDFNWIRENISKEKLMNILIKKESQNELIGIAMTWNTSEIGGEFLFWGRGEISINLNINKKLQNNLFTDVNWYLEKLIIAFIDMGLKIEKYTYQEYI